MPGDVHEAGTAEEAVAVCARGGVGLVFLDMTLGDDDGAGSLQLLEKLLGADPGLRVVIVTALPDDDPHVRRAFSTGAYAYIKKPVGSGAVGEVFERIAADEGRRGRIEPLA